MKKYTLHTLWGTAFTGQPDPHAVAFAAGRDTVGLPAADEALIPYEIQASVAYANSLADCGLIDNTTKEKLVAGLAELSVLCQQGKYHLDPALEDVHTNIESWLTEKLGIEIAGQIHTGRSRNEQTAIDLLLYELKSMADVGTQIHLLVSILNKNVQKYKNAVMPGYTHHQPATVTTFGAILDAFAWEFSRDLTLIAFWKSYAAVSPMGSAAGYGTTIQTDKYHIAKYLNIPAVAGNPIQAITFKGDAETFFVYILSLLLNHISTVAETLILFSTREFGFVTLSDAYSTGSSIMPQKKNPDVLEVMKAKASMVQGYLVSLTGLMKSSFVGYNRDSQWMKYVVMDAYHECAGAPVILAKAIDTLVFHTDTAGLQASHPLLASQAVMEGLMTEFHLPMRLAKIIVESAIKLSNNTYTLSIQNLNKALQMLKYDIVVRKSQYTLWTDPLTIAAKQLKYSPVKRKRLRQQ